MKRNKLWGILGVDVRKGANRIKGPLIALTHKQTTDMHVSLSPPVRHITLIDDDEIVHFLFRALIKKCMPGLDISVYSNASAVLKMLVSNSFQTSAIILDLNMPGMNGLEFLKELEESGMRVPVYVASSSDNPADISAVSVFRNVIKYIVKPITTDHIRMIVQ